MATQPASPAPATARSGVHPVLALEGIGPVFAERLQRQGIRDTAQLLQEDAAALAGKVQAPVATVRHWQAMADLVRVAGIGPQYAEALVRSGVTGTADLLQRDPAELTRQVTAYLASLKARVVGQPVTEPRIQAWQQAARQVTTRARPPRPGADGGAAVSFQRLPPAVAPVEGASPFDDPEAAAASGGAAGGEPGIAFEHMCCKAIRPNPFDPDVDGQGQEARREPYLVDAGRIRPAAGLAIVVFLIGLVGAGSIAFYLAGLSIVAMIVGGVAGLVLFYIPLSLLVFHGALDKIQLAATRHVMEPVVERGKTFHVALDTQGSFAPGSLHAVVSDLHSPGLRPVQKPEMEGFGRIDYMVRAQGRGLLTFKGVGLRLHSGDRLWSQEQEYRYRTTIEVSPSIPAVAFRARITGGAIMPVNMPSHIVKLFRDIENEVTRQFGPGDRLKDVDWKRMAIGGQMIVRQRTSEGDQTVLLVIDTGRSMLQDQAGFRNLDLSLEFAQEYLEAGLRRNHEVGMLAFNEEQILDHIRPARKKTQGRRLTLHLKSLAGHHLPEDGEEIEEPQVIGNPENLLIGLQHGIRQRSTSLLTIVLFSDLRTTPEEIAQGLARAAANGHRVVVMLLPAPKLRPVIPGKALTAEEQEERRGEEHTLRLRELLMGHGVQFLETNPQDDEMALDLPPPSDDPA